MSTVAAPARVERWTPVSASFTAGLAALLALLALAPLVLGENSIDNLIQLYFLVILAIMWNALAGYGGLVSVGQQAFIGIGAYATVFLSVQHSLNPYLSMLLATLIGGAVAIPVAAIVLWLRAGAFAFALSSSASNSGMPEAARVASGPGEIACTRMPFGPSSAAI